MKCLLLAVLLVGCGGEAFDSSGLRGVAEPTVDGGGVEVGAGGVAIDAGVSAGGASAGGETASAGGAPGSGGATGTGGVGTGGTVGMGGASAGGDTSIDVPLPPCCTNADCPASLPFCSPWGTCYQGGNPYNCDYDSFCESFCVHCSGKTAGACDANVINGNVVKRCVCS